MIDPQDLIAIALAAGREILEVYAQDFAVSLKADRSPVTDADLRAEAVILEGLSRLAPSIPIIAEEQVSLGHAPDPGERFFLVDPLDGSKEFIARNGDFTVNIALVEGGRPVQGVVLAPALGRLWWSGEAMSFTAPVESGGGGPASAIRCRPADPKALLVLASRSHKDRELAAYLDRLSPAGLVSRGSALKFCLLAEGEADLYPRFGPTMEWDTAAGDAVLRGAGGSVLTFDGAPLAYGKRGNGADFRNPGFLAAADPLTVPLPGS